MFKLIIVEGLLTKVGAALRRGIRYLSLNMHDVKTDYRLNIFCVLRQMRTSMSITGTSINTPTTVARAAPDERPKSMVDVAIATSKWLEAPIMAAGAAFS